MILTPEQEQQVQRILDLAERAAVMWCQAAEEAEEARQRLGPSDPFTAYLNLASTFAGPNC